MAVCTFACLHNVMPRALSSFCFAVQGPVGKFCQGLGKTQANVTFEMLENTGHCPHDDNPDAVHRRLLPWLDSL